MENIQLLIDFFKEVQRQRPGGTKETKIAIELAALDFSALLKIADNGFIT